ncbi:MAG: pseudouridine synthase [Bacteroidota bacterium]|nr:pseudouridine synthase [Bacteroidota bacterium]
MEKHLVKLESQNSNHKTQTVNRYIFFYKPYAVLSQFSPESGKQTLKDFLSLPKDIYPVGRLDYDSEGLLLLTNDNVIKNKLTDPKFEHHKTYLAQVERIPTEKELQQLRNGVVIEGTKTKPAEVELLTEEPNLPTRSTLIRFRKTVPTAWLKIVLREGRNRQVRKMTAAVGHPTLRLVRIKIGNLEIGELQPGEWKEISRSIILSP